jgi:hypothetical protein
MTKLRKEKSKNTENSRAIVRVGTQQNYNSKEVQNV